jgi:hypothetical protein
MSLGLLAAAGDNAVVDDAADGSEGAAEARALIAADGALASVLRRHRAAHVLGVTPTNSLKKENEARNEDVTPHQISRRFHSSEVTVARWSWRASSGMTCDRG